MSISTTFLRWLRKSALDGGARDVSDSEARHEIVVHVAPARVTFSASEGETVMAAAQRAGLYWPTVCRGVAQCGVCHVEVIGDASQLSTPTFEERARLDRLIAKPRFGGILRL